MRSYSFWTMWPCALKSRIFLSLLPSSALQTKPTALPFFKMPRNHLKQQPQRDTEIQQLKEQLRAKESGELAALRAENSRLKSEASKIEERFEKMIVQRKTPVDEKGFLEKIKVLETEVQALMAQVTKLESEKAKPAAK